MPDSLYKLEGSNQVEPNASTWWSVPQLKAVDPREIVHQFTNRKYDPSDVALKKLEPYITAAKATANPQANVPDSFKEAPGLSKLLTHPRFLDQLPAGAVVKGGLISTPTELASLFEAETPGLWHRHVLNVLLDPSIKKGAGVRLSPPRQALIWAALDMAIASALQAAWYYKWIGMSNTDKKVEYRQRPAEYIGDNSGIIYDLVIEQTEIRNDEADEKQIDESRFVTSRIKRVKRKTPTVGMENTPEEFPGSPRHPAFPSGHSTYSAAASKVLGCFFNGYADDERFIEDGKALDWFAEFTTLSNNIGTARLYGGVHWVDDHEFGQKLGFAVGDAILNQLSNSGIETRLFIERNRPAPEEMLKRYSLFPHNTKGDFCVFQPASSETLQNFQII